jgi:hypothetical protein
MARLLFLLVSVTLLASCSEQKETAKKYPDFFRGSLKGDIVSLEDSVIVVDSMNNMKPDSVAYSLGEFQDGYLVKYTDVDTTGKKSLTTYDRYDNGLLKGIESTVNGKKTYQLKIQLDSNGKYTAAQSFDSTGKMDYYNEGITQNDDGHLTGGKLFKADSGLMFAFTDSYDGLYEVGSTKMDSTGKVTSKTTLVRNDKNDVVMDSTVNISKDTTSSVVKKYRYVYDDMGNWTESTELNAKEKPVKITRRKIVYLKK